MDILSCKGVSLAYEGRTVLSDVDFTVKNGDYLCIVGENGSGKSTLVKTILGLHPAERGKVEYLDSLTRKDIGYLPQQTSLRRDFPASVREVILSGCINGMGLLPFYTKKEKTKARQVMERLGITDIENSSFAELSGGQRQRVLLGRALCSASKLLVMDEPASGLDPIITKEVYSIVSEINRTEGMTVIMVSHDIPAAVKYSTHILHIKNTPLFFGTTEEYKASETARIFLREEAF